MPAKDPRQKKAESRDEARLKALELRTEQQERDKRNRVVAISGLALAVAVLVGVIAFIVAQQGPATKAAGSIAYGGAAVTLADVTGPSTATPKGAIPVGTDLVAGTTGGDKAVVVDVYFDYRCVWCDKFEKANSAEIEKLLSSGGVTVAFHPMANLDEASQGHEYSTRAANATAWVASEAAQHFLAFHSALFANYPGESTPGLSDEKIATIALGVGVPQAVVDKFTTTVTGSTERHFSQWVVATTEQSRADLGPKGGTPTVMINGVKWAGDIFTAGPLTAAVLTAKAAAGG